MVEYPRLESNELEGGQSDKTVHIMVFVEFCYDFILVRYTSYK